MKNLKLRTGTAVMALVFGIMLAGCELVQWRPGIYTVWTGTTTYKEFQDKFGELEEGGHRKFDLTNSEFDQISLSLKDDNKHKWIEDQMINWLMDHDFKYSDSKEAISWLIKIPHGFYAFRAGLNVYLIIK